MRPCLIAAFWAAFLVSDAAAQSICVDRGVALRQLEQRYGEQPTALGLTASGNVVELLTSETGSWTLITTDHHGKTCVISSGDSWETLEPARGDKS